MLNNPPQPEAVFTRFFVKKSAKCTVHVRVLKAFHQSSPQDTFIYPPLLSVLCMGLSDCPRVLMHCLMGQSAQ